MKKNHFCECMNSLREYAAWERRLYDCGFDLEYTPVTNVLDSLYKTMCDFEAEWDYDEKLGLSWIIEWAYTPDNPNFTQTRHGRTWDLADAGVLYDFLVFMNEHGWED